jgi:hypothetical protein
MPSKYIVINPNSNSLNISGNIRAPQEQLEMTFLSTSRRLPFGKGDEFILGSGEAGSDYSFRFFGRVDKVEAPIAAGLSGLVQTEFSKAFPDQYNEFFFGKNLFRFFVTPEGEIESALTLHEQRFSLTKVLKFETPYRHFSRGIRILPSVDYTSILEKRYFVSRSAFGEVFASLPMDLRRQFAYQVLRDYGITNPVNLDFREVLKKLENYIKEKVLSRGAIIQTTRDLLRENFAEIMPIDEVGFIDPDKRSGDSILKQAEYFDELAAFESNLSSLTDQSFCGDTWILKLKNRANLRRS